MIPEYAISQLDSIPAKDLLKLAANAAGIALKEHQSIAVYTAKGLLIGFQDDGFAIRWNPLTNSADAFALLVQMKFNLYRDDCTCCVDVGYSYDDSLVSVKIEQDAEAASRQAIVRAAVMAELRKRAGVRDATTAG
jgi:hypothetical protein